MAAVFLCGGFAISCRVLVALVESGLLVFSCRRTQATQQDGGFVNILSVWKYCYEDSWSYYVLKV